MFIIKEKELTFEELNDIIYTKTNDEDHKVIVLDTCKLTPTKECNRINSHFLDFLIGENCRIDLTQENKFYLENMILIGSHIFHRGEVHIMSGSYRDLTFNSTLGDVIEVLETGPYVELELRYEYKMYVNNYYGNNESILDAIQEGMEQENNFRPCYHIFEINRYNEEILDETVNVVFINMSKMYKDEHTDLTMNVDALCTAKITKYNKDPKYTIHFIGNDVPKLSEIVKLIPTIDIPLHIITPTEIIIDIDISKYPNIKITNPVNEKLIQCRKDTDSLLKLYNKELILECLNERRK